MIDPVPPQAPDFTASRRQLEAALEDPATRTDAHYLLWEVCQACNDAAAALRHLASAIERDPLHTRHVPNALPLRSVLAIAAPGDFQANLPLAMLLDGSTLLHTFWLADPERVLCDPEAAIPAHLPPVDIVFIAISEDERHRDALRAADAFAAALGRPTLNNGATIAGLSREGAARWLADLPDALVPAHSPTSRAALETSAPDYPVVIRPRTSHAGRALARIDDDIALQAYLHETTAAACFYVASYVDFRSPDGQFRKFRIVFVDRVPFPVHLAIHDDWAIWYYNAHMELSADKRAEEAIFMSDMETILGTRAMAALHEIGRRIDLDYFGLDCAVLPDGRLLVFEVETGMIVHDHDPAELFPYKKHFIPRIFQAVADLMDRRILAAAWPAHTREIRSLTGWRRR